MKSENLTLVLMLKDKDTDLETNGQTLIKSSGEPKPSIIRRI